MKKARVAILQFPGTNCEYDALRAVNAVGINGEVVRWTTDPDKLHAYDGYVLPGGFSYQDRVRSGAIAAKLPILSFLTKADEAGKPIIGICNGCQLIAETGLLPNLNGEGKLEMALAHNYQNNKPIGFKHDWIPVVISHGEGRFVFSPEAKKALKDVTVFTYCTESGSDNVENPNGTEEYIAGIANKRGNILAMMPHPERAFFIRQLPSWMHNPWSNEHYNHAHVDEMTPWRHLFESMKRHMEASR
jgi:phosphoribosylformylglycinamidine synthase subunit PurQ / glutaminase